ncbi:MAG: GLPGLI family protein, partial [Tannerella sp.]
MKTIHYILLFMALAVHASAQKDVLDRASMKCMYRATQLKDTLDVAFYEDLLILQIGPQVSKCFSYYTFQNDSLRQTPEGNRQASELFNRALADFHKHRDRNRFLNSFPRNRTVTIVYKNHPAGAITVTDGLREDQVTYRDTLNAQQWTIVDSTREVLGYTCQQATADFRGRHWTAWFATDIPVSDGPWKLGGLPGLILEAYDKGHQYTFTAVGLERVAEEPIVFTRRGGKNGYRTVDRRAFLKAKMFDLTHGG